VLSKVLDATKRPQRIATRGLKLRPGARAHHPPAAGGDPGALDPGPPGRERLLILPIIGVLDGQRGGQLTEQLTARIRTKRARVVVLDITALPTSDSTSPTTRADRRRLALMGASVIITGLSPRSADAGGARRGPVEGQRGGDLQGGIEEPRRLPAYTCSAAATRWYRRKQARWPSRSSSRGHSDASSQSALTDTDGLQLRDE